MSFIHPRRVLASRRLGNLSLPRAAAFRRRQPERLGLEALEERRLLAIDTTVGEPAQFSPYDINQDGYVSALDALLVINELNRQQNGAAPAAASLPETMSLAASAAAPILDVNGDGNVTEDDAQLVLGALDAEAVKLMRIRLEATDLDGNPITQVNVGEKFLLKVYSFDLREAGSNVGVFTTFADVTWNSTLAETAAAINHGTGYTNGASGTASPGLLDEAGGIYNSLSFTGPDERFVFSVEMEATAAGTLTFTSDPPDTIPTHNNLLYNGAGAVPNDQIEFGTATLSILSNEADVTIDLLPVVAVTEGDSGTTPYEFTVTLSAASAQTITVNYATAPGTATAGIDYETAAGTLTFAPGETSKTITVNVLGDLREDLDNENFTLTLANPSAGAVLGIAQRTGVIVDDDAAPSISIVPAAAIVEGDAGETVLNFVVTLSNPSDRQVVVSYSTADGTAIAGEDFTGVTDGTLLFLPGETTKNIPITILGDTKREADQTFTVALSSPINGTLTAGQESSTATIQNDDAPPTVSIAGPATINEGNSGETALNFVVTLSHASDETVTVKYSTVDGTATAGSDYTAATDVVLTFAPGETTKNISVAILGDTQDESDETLSVTLSDPTNATLGSASETTASSTIVNDDAAPVIEISGPESALEGNVGETALTYAVTLSHASSETVTVKYSTVNGTAQAGSDYTGADFVLLTFLPGEISKTFSIPVLGDTSIEPDETFSVVLSDATNATLGAVTGVTTTITNDDNVGALSITGPQAVVEGNAGTQTLVFTVTLAAASDEEVTVDYQTVDGAATAGTDFTAAAGTLIFAPGETSKTISVTVLADLIDEADETFTVTLSNPSNAIITPNQGVATGTIQDDDDPPVISISSPDPIAEGNDGESQLAFNVTLSAPSEKTITVNYSTVNGTAVAGEDFTGVANGSVTFAPGETSKTINIAIMGDNKEEDDQDFQVILSSPANATVAEDAGTATAVIENDDAPPTISIVATASTTEGNSGTKTLDFAVTLSNPTDKTVTVNYSTADGTAVAGEDFTGVTEGTITFAPGETTKNASVTILGDNKFEGDENFTVSLSAPTNATLSEDATATGTITNEDDKPKVSIAAGEAVEGNSGQTTMSFTVTLSNPTDETVTVKYSTSNDTATAGTDYTAVTDGLITFAPGETSKTIQITILGDTELEPNETFKVTLSDPTEADLGTAKEAIGTIQDDDLPTLSISTPNAGSETADSRKLEFVVTLSRESTETVTVEYGTSAPSSGAATKGLDYADVFGTLTFAPGERTKTITVTIFDDNLDEGVETFNVTLSNPNAHAVLGTPVTGVGIINDDDAPPTVTIGTPAIAAEGAGAKTLTFVVTLSEVSGQDVTVKYSTADGTAVAGLDYTAVAGGTLTIPAGSKTGNIVITLLDDTVVEPTENFTVTLTEATNATLGSTVTATGTIADDDATVTISDASIVEGDSGLSQIEFTVTLSSPQDVDVTVRVSSDDGTAVGGEDYRVTNNVLVTIPAGQTTATLRIDIGGDLVREADETFTVVISSPTNARLGAKTTGVGTIINDDDFLSVSGYTYIDHDNNGIKDAGEKGLGGVLIRLVGEDALGEQIDVTAMTAADGSYRFDNLLPGDYNVIQTQPHGLLDGKDVFFNGVGSSLNDNFRVALRGDSQANNNFGERGLPPQQITKRNFFASNNSTPPTAPPALGVSASTSAIGIANAAATSVSGTGTPGAHVAIVAVDGNNHSSAGHTTVVGADGKWSINNIDVSKLDDGTVTYKIAAVDAYGNSVLASRTATKATVAVTTVTDPVNSTNVTNATISGTGVANATIKVSVTGGTNAAAVEKTATVDANGAWTVTGLDLTNLANGLLKFVVTITDAANNSVSTTKFATKGTQ